MLINLGLWYDTDDLDQKAYHYFRKALEICETPGTEKFEVRQREYHRLAAKIMKNYLNGDEAEVEFYKIQTDIG